jgi:chromosome segregation ATPase
LKQNKGGSPNLTALPQSTEPSYIHESLASQVTFLYGVRPLKFCREIKMLEASLSQLEQLVSDLVQQNLHLQTTNAQLTAELAQVRDDNDSLQLSLLEQEEKQGATAARIQALVERATSVGAVSA